MLRDASRPDNHYCVYSFYDLETALHPTDDFAIATGSTAAPTNDGSKSLAIKIYRCWYLSKSNAGPTLVFPMDTMN